MFDSWSLLHAGAHKGSVEVVEALLRCGATVDMRNAKGDTPLRLAASRGHIEVVRRLLAAKADASAKNAQGITPLQGALDAKASTEIVSLLKSDA